MIYLVVIKGFFATHACVEQGIRFYNCTQTLRQTGPDDKQPERARKMKTTTITLCAAVLMTLAVPVQAAGDPKAGQQKNSMCAGCHGIPGWRTAYPDVYSVPKLGGQHADYIIAALKGYKNGERSHPSMDAIVGSLSEQDMEDLAAYYESSYNGPAK
jgi:cytochrome c553